MQQITYHKYILNPGYVAISREPALLCAVCGNGLVVTIWDKVRKFGGMAYCIFPKPARGENVSNYHANTAVVSLIAQIKKNKSRGEDLMAQLFGGGNLKGFAIKRASQLIRAARQTLKKYEIEIISEDVGGSMGRKVVFDTLKGEVMVYKTEKIRITDWDPAYLLKYR